MLADRMQELYTPKETFFPLPTPYHPYPLFFAKEPHRRFPKSVSFIIFRFSIVGVEWSESGELQ